MSDTILNKVRIVSKEELSFSNVAPPYKEPSKMINRGTVGKRGSTGTRRGFGRGGSSRGRSGPIEDESGERKTNVSFIDPEDLP